MRYIFFAAVFILCCSQVVPGFADPTLTVTEARRGSWSFTGLNDPVVIYADPTGCDAIPWVFGWLAVPDSPGKTIDAYRYGFDITDLNDDDAWDTDWCSCLAAAPHTFFFGTHTFHVEVRDNTGAVTRGAIRIDVVTVEVPTLTVTESTRGSWMFVGPEGPPVSLSEPAADPPILWAFEWAAISCGQNAGDLEYRYGWDIVDPDDDNQWSPWSGDLGAPPQTLLAGTHTFMVEVRSDTGAVTRGTVVIEITTGPVPVKKTTWGGVKSRYSD
jgi:hypothetical protein